MLDSPARLPLPSPELPDVPLPRLGQEALDALRTDPEQTVGRLRGWYRWGWLPLVLGCMAIVVAVLVAWETMLPLLGVEPIDRLTQILLILRATTTAVALAMFVGWYVLRSRQRIEEVRTELTHQQAALRELSLRTEQEIGLAAMARVLSHEVRSPLHRMGLQVAVLRRSLASCEVPGKDRDLAAAISAEVDAIDQLVSEYMEYSGEGRQRLELAPLDVGALVRAVVGREAEVVRERELEVEVDAPNPTPELLADATLLRQGLQALVRQAIAACPRGSRLSARVVAEPSAIRVELSDSGPAFEDPASVFRPFYASPRPGASGLALAIVRDVVRAHGGEVHADNLPEGGGRITLRLPTGA